MTYRGLEPQQAKFGRSPELLPVRAHTKDTFQVRSIDVVAGLRLSGVRISCRNEKVERPSRGLLLVCIGGLE